MRASAFTLVPRLLASLNRRSLNSLPPSCLEPQLFVAEQEMWLKGSSRRCSLLCPSADLVTCLCCELICPLLGHAAASRSGWLPYHPERSRFGPKYSGPRCLLDLRVSDPEVIKALSYGHHMSFSPSWRARVSWGLYLFSWTRATEVTDTSKHQQKTWGPPHH